MTVAARQQYGTAAVRKNISRSKLGKLSLEGDKKTVDEIGDEPIREKSFLCFWIFTPVITGGGRDRYIYRFPLSVSFLPLSVSSEPQLLFCLFYFCQMQVCERRKTRKGKNRQCFLRLQSNPAF